LQYGTDDIDGGDAMLWFAGKQMIEENKLSVHVGRHENTKAVVKLQKKGQGAPSREPVRVAQTTILLAYKGIHVHMYRLVRLVVLI
jgi:hypothetical protein